MPHGSTSIDPGYVIAVLYRGRRCRRSVRLLVNRLVVAVTLLLFDFRQILSTDPTVINLTINSHDNKRSHIFL